MQNKEETKVSKLTKGGVKIMYDLEEKQVRKDIELVLQVISVKEFEKPQNGINAK